MKHTKQQIKYINTLRQFQQEYGAKYGITRMGIFGSVARGEQNADSDVDVLVEAPVMGLIAIIGVKQDLEKMMDRPVDVVRKTNYMPERFKARIEREVVYV